MPADRAADTPRPTVRPGGWQVGAPPGQGLLLAARAAGVLLPFHAATAADTVICAPEVLAPGTGAMPQGPS
jgi:hypothetical protein